MRHPDCPYDPEHCQVTRSHYVAPPMIAWTPVYDGNGTRLNADPNTFVDEYSCRTCAGEWTQRRTGEDVQTAIVKMPFETPPGTTLPA